MAGKRVLIVDDVHELSLMLKAALETLSPEITVKIVPSAEEATLELMTTTPDLVVADVRLPGMSGLDLVSRIHSRNSDIRILVVTGLAGEDLPARAQAAGADRFLRKPLHMNDFLAVTSELLGLQPPPEMKIVTAPAQQPAAPETDLAGILLNVRNALGAQLVLLADDTGKVVVQVGERAGLDFEKQWAPTIMSALSAAQKAGWLITPGMPQGALVLRGADANMVLAPVGNYALLILLATDASGLRTALALEEALSAQTRLVELLDRLGASYRPLAAAQVPEAEVEAPALEESKSPEQQKKSTAELKEITARLAESEEEREKQVADEFWEKELDEAQPAPEEPDLLSYEEARRLGLTPDEE